jgi:hypothetical protein
LNYQQSNKYLKAQFSLQNLFLLLTNKMNPLILFASVILVLASCDAKPHNYNRIRRQLPGVPREFQNVNIENYLRNPKAVQFQLKCVLYDGPCDTIGKYLKRNIPVWLRTQCTNCNEDQKKQAGKLINFFQTSYTKEWNDAVAKFGKGAFTDEEIARFESDLGVKIVTDAVPPPRNPNAKPDFSALADLAKESIAILKATKAPIILQNRDTSSTTVVAIPASALGSSTAAPAPVVSSSSVPTVSEPAGETDTTSVTP